MQWRYWTWLFKGLNGRPGIFKFIDVWLLLHLAVATGLTYWISIPLAEVARTMMLPLAGIFIGLSFAWAGNAQALLQSDEIEKLFEQHKDGIENYIYTFQTAILTILISLVGWGLAGLKAFDATSLSCIVFYVEWVLYLISSIAFRECWHVILGSQLLILNRHKIKQSNSSADTEQKSGDGME